MFTIADEVENKSGHPVTLRPWGQVAELTEPTTMGYSVLHEGLIGVFGDSGLKELTYDKALKNFDPATKTPRTPIPPRKAAGSALPRNIGRRC